MYDLNVSFSPCLIISRRSAGLFRCCPRTKWHKKELLSYLKSLMNEVGNFMNHSLAALLRVVGKEWHNISLGGCCRPKVVLKVLRWSKGSFNLPNGSSYGRQNFEGTGHSKIAIVKGESFFLTIRSRIQSVFSFIALLSLSISFLISLRRSKLSSCGVVGHQCLFFLWLSPSSSRLVLDQFSFCYSRNLISWFCRVSSSMLAVSVWICRANTTESWWVLGSI